jgi:hypothetical protein
MPIFLSQDIMHRLLPEIIVILLNFFYFFLPGIRFAVTFNKSSAELDKLNEPHPAPIYRNQ